MTQWKITELTYRIAALEDALANVKKTVDELVKESARDELVKESASNTDVLRYTFYYVKTPQGEKRECPDCVHKRKVHSKTGCMEEGEESGFLCPCLRTFVELGRITEDNAKKG